MGPPPSVPAQTLVRNPQSAPTSRRSLDINDLGGEPQILDGRAALEHLQRLPFIAGAAASSGRLAQASGSTGVQEAFHLAGNGAFSGQQHLGSWPRGVGPAMPILPAASGVSMALGAGGVSILSLPLPLPYSGMDVE